MTTKLTDHGDLIDLGEFATWLGTSNDVAVKTLDDLKISYVRIGARGQYRISTRSVAEAFDVALNQDDDGVAEGVAIAKHRLGRTAAAVTAVPPLHEEVRHVSG